ncbi:hypothetical protein G6F53_013350 [Rhizopus delemar]|nr:hypothetical protein G6F53_013350 [Rhizopus delemar]
MIYPSWPEVPIVLGYKWSPSKCAVLNSPIPSSRRFIRMSLYDEDLLSVDEFVYLGIPFSSKGISVSAMVKHRASSTLFAMSQLNAMGLNRNGFSLLLSARLYASFVRPKLEYGLAIAHLLKKDYTELNRVQDRCASAHL